MQITARTLTKFNKSYMPPMDREVYGPDFDDRLIKLVRENHAIYDVNHPNYRRVPVRMSIWDNIARELNAPSRFLQTKWKNIRYNYMQELKSIETGLVNTNIRKRRFTEDLSFLKNTAYRRDSAPINHIKATITAGSDNDSCNGYMYPDNLSAANTGNTYEVIDLDHSEDEDGGVTNKHECMPDVSAFLAPMDDMSDDSPQDESTQQDNILSYNDIKLMTNFKDSAEEESQPEEQQQNKPTDLLIQKYKTDNERSNRTSPLLASIKPLHTNGGEYNAATLNAGKQEVTLHALSSPSSSSSPTAATFFSPKKQRVCNTSPSGERHLNKRKLHVSASNATTTTSTSAYMPTNDHIELYCLSLVDCLRAMPRSERERVKFEFAKILKDAQYKDQL